MRSKYPVLILVCLLLVTQPRSCWDWENPAGIVETTLEGFKTVAASILDATMKGFGSAPDLIQKTKEGIRQGGENTKKLAEATKNGINMVTEAASANYRKLQKKQADLYDKVTTIYQNGITQATKQARDLGTSIAPYTKKVSSFKFTFALDTLE